LQRVFVGNNIYIDGDFGGLVVDWQAGNNSVNVLWPIVARTDVSLTPNNFSRELKPPVIASPTSGFRLRLPQRDDTKSICVIQRELFVRSQNP
jgi:hypothetical protein